MKKLIIIFTILLSLFSCLFHAQNKIYIFDLSAESPISISCDNFVNSFENMLVEKELNKKKQKKLVLIFSKLDILNKEPYSDVRFKGDFLYNGMEYSFCGDSASILINDKYYSTSEKLIVFLNKLSK